MVSTPPDARPSLFEYAGGAPAFQALARASHERFLADPELNHPFSKHDQHPEHVARLGHYWAEVLGGPATFSEQCSDEAAMIRMHTGNGDMSDLGRRFVECFVLAMDDAGLPEDDGFRAAMRAYMVWAVADVLSYAEPDDVPAHLAMPRWSWDGPVPAQ